MSALGQLRIGTSGYQYPHWRGVFYPAKLSQKNWFRHYAQHFDTVEINNTFYRLPEADTFQAWRRQTPPEFTYAVKFSRFGSHMKKLTDSQGTIGRYVERATKLRSFLGPTLVQLPPRWKVNARRLDEFLVVAPRRLRWAVEFREPSWLCEEIYAILRRRRAAFCIHDMLGEHDWRTTTDWAYVRFHGGGGGRYSGHYTPAFLRSAARRIDAFRRDGLDVYAYFNNDAHGWAVENARRLIEYTS